MIDRHISQRIQHLGLQVTGVSPGELPIATHPGSGLTFQWVRGGGVDMGFSEREEAQAMLLCDVLPMSIPEMRPVVRVVVPDMLVARTPLTHAMAERLLGRRTSQDDSLRHFPAHLGREDAESVVHRLGARLPTEPEWEYFCRAGSPDLFTFGATLPSEAELAGWLDPDCGDLTGLRANAFGLFSLFNAEWCAERFRTSHAPNAAIVDNSFVVKGGGAYFWPWQDQEWVWCASAMRCPSQDVINGECCVRPVFAL